MNELKEPKLVNEIGLKINSIFTWKWADYFNLIWISWKFQCRNTQKWCRIGLTWNWWKLMEDAAGLIRKHWPRRWTQMNPTIELKLMQWAGISESQVLVKSWQWWMHSFVTPCERRIMQWMTDNPIYNPSVNGSS